MSGEPSVLIMARAAEISQGLRDLLGGRPAARLEGVLTDAATRWAQEVAPGRVHVAGEDVPDQFAVAAGHVLASDPGPLLTIWPELPVWRRSVAVGALEDLGAGTDVVLGPLVDGGCYLIGMSRVIEPLFAAPEEAWRARDSLRLGLEAVRGAGLELGLLRSERALRRPGDVRAALADPCLPAALADVLGG